MKSRVYLDYASLAPLHPFVRREMVRALKKGYANPSSLHSEGILARETIESCRKRVATLCDVLASEIIFCGSATESDVLAIRGVVEAYSGDRLPHVIASVIEHSAVRETLKYLEKKQRITVSWIGVDERGIVNPKDVREALRPETCLVSIMYANNEIGTVQPVSEIAKAIRFMKKQWGRDAHVPGVYPLLHTDGAQATPYLPVRMHALGVDLFSCNGTKMGGPSGSGMLYVKKDTPISSILTGGGQESGLRSGTENIPAIIGFTVAFEIARASSEKEYARLTHIQKESYALIHEHLPEAIINGDMTERLPNNINISIPNLASDVIVLFLDAMRIHVSAKSACTSDDTESSYVLAALDTDEHSKRATYGSVRISMGRGTTLSDIKKTIQSIRRIIDKHSVIW